MSFNFNEVEYANSVVIVDALNLAFRWKHRKATSFKEEYVRTVESLGTSYQASRIIITADQGNSVYRKEIFPDYKANRKEKYDTQSEEDKEYFAKFFKEYENTLELLAERGYTVLRFKGVEADDLAAYLVKKRKNFFASAPVWLISSDRDWDLLINPDVSRFSYVTRKETTWENWSEHYNVTPEQYISLKCLQGDSGDNVPGIPGIGPTRAANLLATYEDAMTIYDCVPLEGKAKYIQKLNENAEQILINYSLMDLISFCEDAIGYENILEINETLSQEQ